MAKPGRRYAGTELAVCLVYPNSSRVGRGNLGFQKIFSAINSHGAAYCDIAFLSESPVSPRSVERDIALKGFDVLAFSVTFEMDELNVLKILKTAGVPITRGERKDGDPIVCAGGVAVTLNPEPMSDFIDFFVIGDGEDDVGSWLSILEESRGHTRRERLAELAALDGIYVPSLYDVRFNDDGTTAERVAKNGAPERVTRLYKRDYPASGMMECIDPEDSVFKESFLIETGKGCGQGCRFCAAGFIYRPVRHVKKEVVKRQIAYGLTERKKIGLVGSAISEHPDIDEIYDAILERGGGISVSSLRVEYADRATFRRLDKGGARSVSIAPEAGSERLRRIVNKDISDDEIVDCVTTAAEEGILNVKLYFLIGLPEETPDDVTAIATLVKKIRDGFVSASRVHGRAGRINVSVNPFVPKPNTPFQWARFAEMNELKKKIKLLKQMLIGEPNIVFKAHSVKNGAVQALLSLGSRRVGSMILNVFNGKSWNSVLRMPEAKIVYARVREKSETLPWDFIDSIVERSYLWREYEKAKSGKITPPCPTRETGCKRCGVFEGNCF